MATSSEYIRNQVLSLIDRQFFMTDPAPSVPSTSLDNADDISETELEPDHDDMPPPPRD